MRQEACKDVGNRLLIFSATYNEIGNIRELLEKIWQVRPDADILIVDDNSPDGTGALLDEIAAGNARLTVVHRPDKLGLGTAHLLAMLFAIRRGFDTLVTMDADHSHDPREIPKLLDALSASDFVIGSRYMPGGSSDYRGYRRFVSVAANSTARLLLRIPLHEFTTSFRAFRVEKLKQVNVVKMHNNGYPFFMESVYRLTQAGLRVAEVPITFRDRYAGVSKIPRFEIVRGILKLLHLTVSKLLRRKMPPAAPEVTDRCASCGSEFLAELFPRQIAHEGREDARAFRCSSMEHSSKPRVARCLWCGLCQVPLSEQPKDLDQLYADVVDQTYLDNLPAKRKTFSNAYKRISPILPPPGGRLLEIGSYCGLFLSEASSHGWKVKGIEPSHWASEYARSTTGLDVVHGALERIAPELLGNFDVVISWDVLEHVRDPKLFLRLAFELLRPGGILALSTIDIDSWFPRLLGGRWPWIMEMHLYYFGSGSLERMFADAGFDVVCVEPYRHYASLNYAYRKLCAAIPQVVGRPLAKASFLVPHMTIPITFGDVKLYAARRSVPASPSSHVDETINAKAL